MKIAPININQLFQGKLVYDKEQVAKKDINSWTIWF